MVIPLVGQGRPCSCIRSDHDIGSCAVYDRLQFGLLRRRHAKLVQALPEVVDMLIASFLPQKRTFVKGGAVGRPKLTRPLAMFLRWERCWQCPLKNVLFHLSPR